MLANRDRVDWKAEIDRNLALSGIALILWSEGADSSERLQHELALAHELGIELVLSLDGAMPQGDFENLEVLDFRDFDALEIGRGVPTLLAAIVRRCGLPPRWANLDALLEAVEDSDLPRYRFGNVEIPASVLLGTPDETYAEDEVGISFTEADFHLQPGYPETLRKNYDYLLSAAFRQHEVDPLKVRDNPLVRLDSLECLPEGPNDEKGPLHLRLSRTSYFQIWATNVAVDIPLPDEGLWTGVQKGPR